MGRRERVRLSQVSYYYYFYRSCSLRLSIVEYYLFTLLSHTYIHQRIITVAGVIVVITATLEVTAVALAAVVAIVAAQ